MDFTGKFFGFFCALGFTVGGSSAFGADFKENSLGGGSVKVYDFGAVKLHAYNTADVMSDECFLVETGNGLIGVESPAFSKDIALWKDYISSLSKPFKALLVSAHPSGGRWYGGADVYATAGAAKAIREGATKALCEKLEKAYGKDFIADTVEISKIIGSGENVIEGVKFVIIDAGDFYDIEIPAANALYTHMLGADVHSILAGQEHMAAVIETLECYKKKNYGLILSAHHEPEPASALDKKINYVKRTAELSSSAKTAAEFIEAMKAAFPKYGGVNYLEMSAGYIFPE